MDSNGLLNIYEQYYIANLRYGFYLRENTWHSIGQVLFIVGVNEGENLKGNPPYFNNPKVYVKLFYVNSIKEINSKTKSRIIKIYDGCTYRYQPVDENFILPSKESIKKRTNTTRKFDVIGDFFGINTSEDLSFIDKLKEGDSQSE
ncbi:hypothetical protein [Yeosuana marina]|uniref:hypothetical protein n=1 Tax=Yeosuana marina TaxID=1565536 RepID=UPI0030C83536